MCSGLYSHATMTVSISSLMQAGSNFRAMYVVDWDKENYFSVLNVRRRKFEKERLERQLQAEAERIRKEEIEAEFARAEAEKLKMEQMAAALRCLLDFLDMNVMLSEFESLRIIKARVQFFSEQSLKRVYLLWLLFLRTSSHFH